ncbi:thioesterase II family protein [Saccharothrix syringae]|uniref:Thioesterase n=1 Tax=Saccharothrix syringae TaxID=103733 RepID=A0A5Q0H5U2_SACSY|nr:alpha/beta fold hydrolase [Saccharothrix syringae]QFZ21588.1 thioesterase [Saccharothrix syringae]
MTAPTTTGPWLRRFQPTAQAPVRLVCFPHAGGSASYFVPLAKAHAPGVDVLAVQYPGRQDRRGDPAVPSITELAEHLVPELLPWTDRPFAFFGHSMGATLAFEVTRRLEARGVAPVRLFASARRGPTTFRGDRLHLLGDQALLAELQALGGTDFRLVDQDILSMVLPALRADYQAVETYEFAPGPRLRTPITVLIGDADPKVSLEEARTWEQHTEGGFELEVFPGGHFYLTEHAAAVNALIADRLSGAR